MKVEVQLVKTAKCKPAYTNQVTAMINNSVMN